MSTNFQRSFTYDLNKAELKSYYLHCVKSSKIAKRRFRTSLYVSLIAMIVLVSGYAYEFANNQGYRTILWSPVLVITMIASAWTRNQASLLFGLNTSKTNDLLNSSFSIDFAFEGFSVARSSSSGEAHCFYRWNKVRAVEISTDAIYIWLGFRMPPVILPERLFISLEDMKAFGEECKTNSL